MTGTAAGRRASLMTSSSPPRPRQAMAMLRAGPGRRGAVRLVHRRRDLRPGQVPAGLAGRTRRGLCDGHPAQRHLSPPATASSRAEALIAALPARAWQRLPAAPGAHGPRVYDWAGSPSRARPGPGRRHWLLARRSLSRPDEIAYYACYGPAGPAGGPGRVAGSRWAHRGMLPASQKRSRARPLPGPPLATPGMPTSPCRCWPWPGWPPAERRPQKGNHREQPGHDRLHVTGNPPPAHQLDPGLRARPHTTSGPGPPGGCDANTRPGSATTGDAAMPSPNCRCSTSTTAALRDLVCGIVPACADG